MWSWPGEDALTSSLCQARGRSLGSVDNWGNPFDIVGEAHSFRRQCTNGQLDGQPLWSIFKCTRKGWAVWSDAV